MKNFITQLHKKIRKGRLEVTLTIKDTVSLCDSCVVEFKTCSYSSCKEYVCCPYYIKNEQKFKKLSKEKK